MLITKTPFRISFVGGGSDLPAYYTRKAGAVLSASINKYMYISSHQFFEEDKIRVKYSKTETVAKVDDLQHPILRVVFDKMQIKGGLEVSSIADVPAGTGLGSSSAFTVGLLQNLYARQGKLRKPTDLAKEACEIEIDILKEPIGKQDQYASAIGGLNIFRFKENGQVEIEPMVTGQDLRQQLERNLVMFYTGIKRNASDILHEQKENSGQSDKLSILTEMVGLVDDLKDSLNNGNLDDFGRFLHQNWLLKQKLASGISNSAIEEAYNTGLKNGALGGKLLGAGGGGFIIFYCPQENQERLMKGLKGMRMFPFGFDTEGSKVIYYGDE